jgi:hypothetical protein
MFALRRKLTYLEMLRDFQLTGAMRRQGEISLTPINISYSHQSGHSLERLECTNRRGLFAL